MRIPEKISFVPLEPQYTSRPPNLSCFTKGSFSDNRPIGRHAADFPDKSIPRLPSSNSKCWKAVRIEVVGKMAQIPMGGWLMLLYRPRRARRPRPDRLVSVQLKIAKTFRSDPFDAPKLCDQHPIADRGFMEVASQGIAISTFPRNSGTARMVKVAGYPGF